MSESSPPASSRRTDRRVSRRVGQNEPSTVMVGIRMTPQERDDLHALAEQLKVTMSDLVRRLVEEERARVSPEKRASKRPRKG